MLVFALAFVSCGETGSGGQGGITEATSSIERYVLPGEEVCPEGAVNRGDDVNRVRETRGLYGRGGISDTR
jgi:hypothetical protein